MRAPATRAAALLMGLVTCTVAVPVGAQTDALATARAHYFAGEYDEALGALRPFTRGDDTRRDALVLHARVLKERGEYADALDFLDDRGAERRQRAPTHGNSSFPAGRYLAVSRPGSGCP